MSRLNGTLRFSATFVNTFIFMFGVITVGGGAFLISATTSRFDSKTLSGLLAWIVIAGLVFLTLSVTGCCGTFHQTLRKGFCRGRRVLGFYNVIVMGIIVAFLFFVLALRAIRGNFKYVQAYPSSPLDHTEGSMLSPYFNFAYYKAAENYVVKKDGFKWFAAWVYKTCPASMDVFSCKSCTSAAYSPTTCCPSQVLCDGGNIDACPYYRCRAEIAKWLSIKMRPWERTIFILVLVLLGVMLNTCLLICYNPRDSLSDLLTKTGAVVHKGGPPKRRTPRTGNTPRGRASQRRTPVGSPNLKGVRVESPPRTATAVGGSPARRDPTPGSSPPPIRSPPVSPRRSIDGRSPHSANPTSPQVPANMV